jgi:hypothetical protein
MTALREDMPGKNKGRKNHKTIAKGFSDGYGGNGEKGLPEGMGLIYNNSVTSFLSGSATERSVRARN